MKDLQKTPGFRAYLILNNEGIVLKWGQVGEESMSYETALKYSHHVLSLCDKSKVYVKDLFEVSLMILVVLLSHLSFAQLSPRLIFLI